jgi:hypothetical protein
MLALCPRLMRIYEFPDRRKVVVVMLRGEIEMVRQPHLFLSRGCSRERPNNAESTSCTQSTDSGVPCETRQESFQSIAHSGWLREFVDCSGQPHCHPQQSLGPAPSSARPVQGRAHHIDTSGKKPAPVRIRRHEGLPRHCHFAFAFL